MKNSLLLFSATLMIALCGGSASMTAEAATKKCDLEKMKWKAPPFDDKWVEHPECRPQILYSWLSSDKILDPKDPLWPFRRGRAFLFRSPLGTFLYGRFSYRVKLKPDVKFKAGGWTEKHANCLHPEDEMNKTVYIAYNPSSGFSEYVICSPEVVESWSFGMPEHLEEMKRERRLIEVLGPYQVDGFLKPKVTLKVNGTQAVVCETCFQKYMIHDARNDGTKADLDHAFAVMNRWVSQKRGRVYTLADEKSHTQGPAVARHFETKLPFLFHRDGAPVRYEKIRIDHASSGYQTLTDVMARRCDGKSDCRYEIRREAIGGYGPVSAFDITWSCVDTFSGKAAKNRTRVTFNENDLEGHQFTIRCDLSGRGQIKEDGESFARMSVLSAPRN